jgi:tetratricopeptide (TPR) repeat protein
MSPLEAQKISPKSALSPAELGKLEHAFASDPSSDAFRPLAEAYLSMGRFMEAMVVCKKGVKAHPTRSDARMLLARVYAEQGKDKKALEELVGAQTALTPDKAYLRMMGALQLKSGEAVGAQTLLKALELDPADVETLAVMSQWKVDPPKKAEPPPPPPPPAPAPVAAAPVAPPAPSKPQVSAQRASTTNAPYAAPAPRASTAGTPAPTPAPRASGAAPRASTSGIAMGGSARASAVRPRTSNPIASVAPRASGMRSAAPAPNPFEGDETSEVIAARSEEKTKQVKGFGIFAAVAVLGLLGWFGYGQMHGKNVRELRKRESEALHLLDDDSYDSYQQACKAAEAALEKDASSPSVHGILAYAYAVRFGEHGGGEDARKQAEANLSEAQSSDDARLIAAGALLKAYTGHTQEAMDALDKQVRLLDEQKKSSAILNATLGVLQMNEGDYEHALDNLTRAQELAPANPRIYAELGTLYRRRGEDKLAWRSFKMANQYKPGHPDATLGMALMWVDSDKTSFYPNAAQALKKFLDAQPPPSPRQLAVANMARALLIARVQAATATMPEKDKQDLFTRTGVPSDARSAHEEIVQAEELAMKTLDRENPELHLIKAHRLLAENHADQAVEEMKSALQQDGTRPQLYLELARILLMNPQGAKEAIGVLKTAITKVGESPKLMVMLGEAYRQDGKLDEALAQFSKAVADPKVKNPAARLAMGAIYLEKKDYANAEGVLTKAAQDLIGQSTKVAEANTLLGRAAAERGDRPKAEAFFKKALTSDADYADAYFWYAKFLVQQDATREAGRKAAGKYLTLDPAGRYANDAKQMGPTI